MNELPRGGCSLAAPEGVTGYTGGSVLLSCYCTDGGTILRPARWFFQPGRSDVLLWSRGGVHNHYKDRMLIPDSPGNMSLRLSDLTLSDWGTYRCETDEQFKDIKLTVKESLKKPGCVFSDSGPIHITGSRGHSVVLPCACTDVQIKPKRIKWTADLGNQNTVIFPQGPTSGRVQLLDSVSPGNLSLRLSDLTLSDGGTYRCEADGLYRDIILTVKVCDFSDSGPIHITGSTGHSVVLPCACTDVQIKPKRIKWTADLGNQNTVIFPQDPTSGNDRYKNRVQLLDSVSPGNLSLRLSDLTLSDGGTYRCSADGLYRDIRLTVKGCVFSDSGSIPITGFTGHSVVLPCACTDVQIKPEQIKWTAVTEQQSAVIFPPRPSSGRVQLLDSVSPGNLSLRLSDLTLSDEGTYRCEADGQFKDIILTVIHRFEEFCLKV
ncbi:V-set and immunoglobulin domain-containing protein 1-like [Conger conger]|uniref:V-set and immunoglobulin domain-containing protein 1-like n=1 Tax=Conger conger TaxID=82655 RepID=UPI002A59890F|nr:V-set and immunoglobulin domain-containing protein 1-like [Conger conger]